MTRRTAELLETVDDRSHLAEREPERYYLVIFDQQSSSMFPLPRRGEIRIGRDDDVDLKLQDTQVSRRHATIFMADGEATVSDLGSHNGTHVNGEKISKPVLLQSGDTVSICGYSLVFYSTVRRTAITQLLELNAFRARAEQEVERSLRYDRPLSLACLMLGAPATSRTQIAHCVTRALRPMDAFTWSREDELLVLLLETRNEDSRQSAEQILESVRYYAKGAKIGISSLPSDALDIVGLMANARAAATETKAGNVASSAETFRTIALGDHKAIVADPAMLRLYALVERLAPSELAVLVTGETGTGKELVASAVHHFSKRRTKSLVSINCAALNENLLESELFGHEKGAFSGAVSSKPGRLEAANGGTIFLDEIGEMSGNVQAKLLRVLETRKASRVGSVRETEVDVRVVAATNRDLHQDVKEGRFRKDLFFRLSGATLWLPPLRDRRRELPILAQTFLVAACEQAGRAPVVISDAAMQIIASHRWPGNIRELKNVMQFAAATITGSALEPWHLTPLLGGDANDTLSTGDGAGAPFRPIEEEIQELERRRMTEALEAAQWNQTKAAKLIHMPLRTFITRMKQYGLVRSQTIRG